METNLKKHYSQLLQKVNSNTKIEVLKDKETNDLLNHLKEKGIDLTTVGSAIDLGGIKLIYTFFDRASKNNEFTELEDFKIALQSLNGKPLAIDHTFGKVVGHYVTTETEKNRAVSYLVFYKRHFPEIWKEVQKRAGEGNLRHSWHILNPKDSTIKNNKDNVVIKDMILSGGSLVMNGNPAYSQAYILRTATRKSPYEKMTIHCTDKLCSHYSALTPADIITEENHLICDKCGYHTIKLDVELIKCPRCGGFLRSVSEDELIKIRESKKEDEIYVSCPNCSSDNWKTEKTEGDIKIARCLSCLYLYEIKFSDMYFPFQLVDKRKFICPSCGYDLSFYTTLEAGDFKKEKKCPNCGIKIDISSKSRVQKLRRIIAIKEIKKEEMDENLSWFNDLTNEQREV